MDWTQSYSASWRVFKVDRRTWADGEKLNKVESVNVSRTTSGYLLESGSMETTGEFTSGYYRVVMDAEQSGELARVDVATLLFNADGGKADYGTTLTNVTGHSVLYPASTTSIITGEYAPKGVDGARYAGDLLAGAINAPVSVEGSFILNDHVVFELGAAIIEAVWDVLEAGNFTMQIDGRGTVHIIPKQTVPSLVLSSSNLRLLESEGIDYTEDRSELPNRYIVIQNNVITTAVNDRRESEISTVNRGYFIDYVDTSPTTIDGETLNQYAQRRLRELSILHDKRSYVREFADGVYLNSIVRGSIYGLNGDYIVTDQSITCDKGITVSEKASREISLW